MEFNKYWTKEDNNLLREFIKESKSVNYIRDYFGNEKLFYHPSKKYYQSYKNGSILTFKNKIDDFSGFLNEIRYNELKTDFQIDFEKSPHFKNEFNYIYKFQTNSGNRYVVDFVYIKDNIGIYKNRDIYNISFTLEKNNSKDYEKLSFLKEEHEIIKRIIFIFKNFNNKFGDKCIYLIGEMEDKRKILQNKYIKLVKFSISLRLINLL
jgi:hypothetical protein